MSTDTNLSNPLPKTDDRATPSSKISDTIAEGGLVNTSGQNDQFGSVFRSPHIPQKYGGKKVIATIFGIILLVGAVGAGVLLVQRQQELRERAASISECSHSSDCVLLSNERNQGSFTASRTITHAFITDQNVHRFDPGQIDDGCYRVTIEGNYISWDKYGQETSCKDVSRVQVWLGSHNTPTPADN